MSTVNIDTSNGPCEIFHKIKIEFANSEKSKSPFTEPITFNIYASTSAAIKEPVVLRASWIDEFNDDLLLTKCQTNMVSPNKYMIPITVPMPKAENLAISSLFGLSIIKFEIFLPQANGNKPAWSSCIFVNVEDPSGKYKKPTDEDTEGEDIGKEESEDYEEEEEDSDLGGFIVNEEENAEEPKAEKIECKDNDNNKENQEDEEEHEETNEETPEEEKEVAKNAEEKEEEDKKSEKELVVNTEFFNNIQEKPTEELLATFIKKIVIDKSRISKVGMLF